MHTTQANEAVNLDSTGETQQRRKLSWPLIAGIILVPLVCAFFTLRKGYSSKVRIAAFVWLLLYLAGSASHHGGTKSTAQYSDSGATEQSQVADPNASFRNLAAGIRQTNTPMCQNLADLIENRAGSSVYLGDSIMVKWVQDARYYQCIN
jgi:hypothetical protein